MISRSFRAICLLAVLGFHAPVVAAAGAGTGATVLKLDTSARFDAKGGKVPGQFVLNATLTTADSKPLSNKEVRFSEAADFFGARDAFLGSATTDATGHATLLFQPAQPGTAKLKVQFAGDTQFAPQSGSTALPVAVAVSPYKPQPLPLAPLASGLAWGVCVVAIGVWAVLVGVLVRTTLGIRASGRAVKGGRPVR